MSNYVLTLKSNINTVVLPLREIEFDEVLNEYEEKVSGDCVYNDAAYTAYFVDEAGINVHVEQMYINDELVEPKAVYSEGKSSYLFLECFGVVRIEVVIDGKSFITSNLKVIMKEDSINQNVINMIDYIYDNCDDYLYEEHKHSKISTGVNPNINISIDTKLALLDEIFDVYARGYSVLKYSAQSKLVNSNKIGNFNELQFVNQNTIDYIVSHPEELWPVDYNSGIMVNKQYYEPRKTLVQSVSYSFDIYENQIVIGFLKAIIKELEDIECLIDAHQNMCSSPYRNNGYIDSSFFIYTRNVKFLNKSRLRVQESQEKFKKLLFEYKKILIIKEVKPLTNIPKFTNVFRRIMPYNAIFECIIKWFNCGNYDLKKSDLLLSFVSISKIYEYYALLKLNKAIENCGYSLIDGSAYKYEENRYYKNTLYNNTFIFSKEDISITVYYQPIILGKIRSRERPNNINVFRNNSYIIPKNLYTGLLDDKPTGGNCYTPDYLIKICRNNIEKYFVIDAKHSTVNNILNLQLVGLTFKYLFSLSTLPDGGNVEGLCVLCAKGNNNTTSNIYNIAEEFNKSINPKATICEVTGTNVNDNSDLERYIKSIVEVVV